MLSKPLFDLARPRHKLEARPAVRADPLYHGMASRGQDHLPPICSADMLTPMRMVMRQAGLAGQLLANRIKFAPAQGGEEVALQCEALALTARKTLVNQMTGPRLHRLVHFPAKAAHRKRHAVLFDQPVIQPRGTGRGDLGLQIKVGAAGQHQRRARIVRASETADLHDPALGRRVIERLKPPKPDMMRAAIRAVDHGVGLAGQLVVQALFDQPPDDW